MKIYYHAANTMCVFFLYILQKFGLAMGSHTFQNDRFGSDFTKVGTYLTRMLERVTDMGTGNDGILQLKRTHIKLSKTHLKNL